MPRQVVPLTDTKVKNAKPKEKVYKLSDGDGLQLRVKPNGSKSWLLDYLKPLTKKRTSLSFGEYPDITLSNARTMRIEAKKLLAKNIDPKVHRDETLKAEINKNLQTFAQIVSEWFEVKRTKITADYADDVWRSFVLHVFPSLAETSIHDINAPDTIAVLRPLAAKGSLETVRRVCQRLNEVMTFACNTGVIHANPLAGISDAFENPKKKHLPTIEPGELSEFLKKLSRASIKITTRCLIEWQLHTMVRPSEAAGAKWEEIDWDNRLWKVPAERMKKKKAHNVPLTVQTIAILEEMKPISAHREYIFPSDRDPKKHANSSTANMAIKRMGFGGKLVSHGLRSLASTTLNEKGFDYDVIESALAHEDKNSVRSAYNRAAYIEQRRELMEWWSTHIVKASSGTLDLGS